MFVMIAVVALGCTLSREAIEGEARDEESCVAGEQKVCPCPFGDDGIAVCDDGAYGPCTGCLSSPAGGTGARAGAGGTGDQGGYAGASGSSGNGEAGAAGPDGTGGEGGVTAGTGGSGGNGAVGGAGDGGGGSGGTTPSSGSCPPPYLCQSSPLLAGIFYCSDPAGLLGPTPPFCATNADCDAAGLPGVACTDAGLGLAVCLLLCVP
jgi:hypothetical protein